MTTTKFAIVFGRYQLPHIGHIALWKAAAEIGEEAGMHYVYAGNLPGKVGSLEDTHCPKCCSLLIQRQGYWIKQNLITSEGTCPKCGQKIPGVWN